MLKLKLQYFGHMMVRADLLEKTLLLGKLEGRTRVDRGWDVWMASLTQRTWVWENSGQGRTGKPDVLQSLRSQRVGYDWLTKQQFSPEPIHPLTIHWNFSCKVHQWLYSAKSNDPHSNPSISLDSSSDASLNFFLHLASATQSTLAFTLITHWSLFSTFLTCPFSFLQPLKVDMLQGSLVRPLLLVFCFHPGPIFKDHFNSYENQYYIFHLDVLFNINSHSKLNMSSSNSCFPLCSWTWFYLW